MPNSPSEEIETTKRAARAERQHAVVETDTTSVKLVGIVSDRPWAIAVVRLIKKARTKVGFLVAAWCLLEGVYFRERPFALDRPNAYVVIGLILIASGLAFRLAALGCIHKKECLATDGVYSLCRHPLYFGSILLAYGFCILLADSENYVLVSVYFAVFYPITILWEEMRLEVLYGEAHRRYRAGTPLLLPLGAFRKGTFTWQTAMLQGGSLLLATVTMLLGSVQMMAVIL